MAMSGDEDDDDYYKFEDEDNDCYKLEDEDDCSWESDEDDDSSDEDECSSSTTLGTILFQIFFFCGNSAILKLLFCSSFYFFCSKSISSQMS